jgi:hypothetical protein
MHILHVSCALLRSLDVGSILHLFKDSLKDIYDNTILLDNAEAYHAPKDYSTALNDAAEAAMDQPVVESDTIMQLCLFEFINIAKTRGIHTPYVATKWPEI